MYGESEEIIGCITRGELTKGYVKPETIGKDIVGKGSIDETRHSADVALKIMKDLRANVGKEWLELNREITKYNDDTKSLLAKSKDIANKSIVFQEKILKLFNSYNETKVQKFNEFVDNIVLLEAILENKSFTVKLESLLSKL